MSKAVSSDSGVDFASLKIAPAIHNPEKVICVGLGVEVSYVDLYFILLVLDFVFLK